jgi:hypothetical protein
MKERIDRGEGTRPSQMAGGISSGKVQGSGDF